MSAAPRPRSGPPALPARFVLVRPRRPENLGAAARVLANFGFDDWAIVGPGPHDFATARRVAVHAEALLDRPAVVEHLDEAVADCTLVVGTTSRKLRGRRAIPPAEVALLAARERGRGRLALVFGDERDGLSAEALGRCDEVSTIPTSGAQPSLNLAQAVAVYAHAVRQVDAEPTPAGPGEGATDEELRRLEEALRQALRRCGFLVGPERHAVEDLVASLRRARLSRGEVRLWMAALSRLASPRA